MNKLNKLKESCRTCLNASKGLLSLSDETQHKSYGEMLNDVTNINITNDKCNELPQVICGSCSRKLKAAHAFVQQAQCANEKLWLMLKDHNAGKQLDCLQESQIDIQSCLEIKMEHEDVDNSRQEEASNKNLQFKVEETDEEGLSSINIDMAKSSISQNDENFSQNNSSDSKISRKEIKISESDEFSLPSIEQRSESDNNDDCGISSDGSEFKINVKKPDKKKPKLSRLKKRKSHHDDPLEDESNEQIKNKIDTADEMLPARCEDCDKVFPNSRLLSRHRRGTHVPDELKIQCPHCEAKFSRRHNMYAHMRVVHKTENIEKHQLKPKQLPKDHACLECSRSYTSKYRLLAHAKSQHNPERKSAAASCPEKLTTNPRKRFLCTLCGLTFDSQSNLSIHYRRHTGEKPYKCDYCDRAYHRLYDAQVHRRSHTGEKPYQCTICEKAFRRSNKLKIHIRTHTNERPYKCTQCEKAFKQSKDLNIHKRTHTGERPYKCSVCQSTFTQSNSLRLHQTKQKHFEVTNPVLESSAMYEPSLMIETNN